MEFGLSKIEVNGIEVHGEEKAKHVLGFMIRNMRENDCNGNITIHFNNGRMKKIEKTIVENI